MKNNFQSKSVPRGTRTIWRYLGALFILFTFAIGNVWATATTVDFVASTKDDSNVNLAALSNGDTRLVGGGLAKLIAANSVSLSTSSNKYGYRCDGSRLYIVFKFDGVTDLTIKHNTNSTGARYMRLYSFSSTKSLSAITSSDWSSKTQVAFTSTDVNNTWGGGQKSGVTAATNKLSWNYGTKGCLTITWEDLPAGYYVLDGTGSEAYVYSFTADVTAATTYSVTYSPGVGSVKEGKSLPTQAAVAAGTEITLASAEDLEKEGKEFDGWLCDINSTKYAAGAKYTMTAAATTFTAQWRDPAPKYKVTYSLNGPSGDAPTETDKAAGDVFTLASAPSWAGHAFDGWLCNIDSDVKAAGSSYTMTAAPTTFTAQWHELECKIYSFTGEIGSASPQTTNATVDAEKMFVKDSGDKIRLTPATGESFKVGDILTFSGNLNNSAKKFGLKLYADGGSSVSQTIENAVGTVPMICSAALTFNADYIDFARADGTGTTVYTCEVHRSCAEGVAAGLAYATTEVAKTEGDAAFTNPLTNANGLVIAGYKSSSTAVATVATNGQVTVVGPGSATITAYSAVQTKAGTLYAAGTASYTLTVAALPKYHVTYNLNGGSGDVAEDDHKAGEKFTLHDGVTGVTAPGSKTFVNWKDQDDALFNGGVEYTMPAKDVTLTAQWAGDVYTVKFMDGETVLDTKVVEVGSHPTDIEHPTKPLYTFAAWQLSGSDVVLDDVTGTKDATVILTARWTAVYALDVNFKDAATQDLGVATALNTYHYASDASDISFEAKGLKIKTNEARFYFNVAPGKVAEIKFGNISGATYSVDGGAAETLSTSQLKATYSASAQSCVMTMTTDAYNIVENVVIHDPYEVTFNANGGDPVASLYGHPAVTLPDASNGTKSLLGWFDAAEGGNKIGDVGESYTPAADIELFAQWEDVSTDARLASITFSSDAGTLVPAFNPEVTEYTYTMPYGTAAIPTITGATAVNANAQTPIIGDAAAAWGEAQTIKGVAQSGDKKTYTITMKVAPKDGVVIIHADIPSGTSADYAATGLYAGTGTSKNEGSSLKLGTDHYAGVTLSGGEIFKAGDILNVHVKTINGFVKAPISTTNAVDGSGVIFIEERSFVLGDNFITLTSAFEDANSSSLYLVRTTPVDAACNPAVDYIEVKRPMNPVLTAITINGRDGEIDALDDKHFTVTIPNDANLASLTVVPTIVRNAPHATTPEQVMTNSGAWVLTADGDNTYRIMDKDGDYTDYTITLIRDVLKHTVRFMDGASVYASDDQVEDGATVTAPATDPTKDEYIFKGWSETVDGEVISDWSAITITADKDFYAIWEAEPAGIKLFTDLGLNTTNFISAAKATDSVEINTVKYPCLVNFASNRSSLAGAKQGDLVMYSATTDAAKIKFDLYNANGSAKTAYVWLVEEGDDAATQLDAIEIAGETRVKTAYYEFNGTKNRTVYLTSGSKADIKVLQAKVIESGNAIKQFGQAGYSLNLNKGRLATVEDVAVPFEGATLTVSSEYSVLNSSNLATKSANSFNVASPVIMHVERSGGKYYVYQDPADKGTLYTANADIELNTTGTWYISSETTSSAASFTLISFLAPKCAEPAFNALTNSDICSGDPYVALDGTATVTDAGVPTYQWYREDDSAIDGETNATYTPTADGKYYVIAVNHLAGYTDNEKKSALVTVTTHAGTVITEPLVDLRGAKDAEVTLTVTATGKNLHYAWKESATIDGTYTDVAGATDSKTLNVTVTEDMDKYYKVVVSSDCGSDLESVAHVTQFVPVSQQDVTASIVWDWSEAASGNTDEMKTNTTPVRDTEFIMANGDARIYNNANFWSDKLVISGQYAVRGGNYFQGGLVKFHTTVPGVVRVEFSHTGTATADKPVRELFINGVGTGTSTASTSHVRTAFIEVPAGDVSITAQYIDPTKPGNQYVRVYKVEFYTIAEQRTTGYAAGDLGTVCLEDATIIDGANLYKLAGLDQYGYLAFDEIQSGELEAGVPYLFEVTNPSMIGFYKQVNAAHSDDEIAHKGMIGTFSGTTLNQNVAENYYYFSGRHIWRVNDFTVGITIPAHRCYVDYDAVQAAGPAQAPAAGCRRVTMGVNGKDAAQGFENILGGETPMKVMIDGTLYIIRGEKVFDATGRLVK